VSRPADPATPIPGAVPPRVAAWLADAPDGPLEVLHAGREVLHLAVADRAVGVAGAGVPGLPHAIRTSCVWMTTGRSPTPYLESGILRLDARALVTGRLVDVRAPRLDAARVLQASPAAAQGTPRPRGAGLVAFPDLLGGPLTPGAAAALVGRGEGLTPWGDDVLCGWLALHRALGVPTPAVDAAVRGALPRTTTLSATLLDCALAGEVADLLGHHLRCLGTPDEDAARTALEGLGHSSGRGLALGVDLARTSLAGRVAA
jgi:hypothetical protein